MRTPSNLTEFANIWVGDFEFMAPDGDPPTPICYVVRNLVTGVVQRRWLDETAAPLPIYGTGPTDLFVAYFSSAEVNCHLQLHWPIPIWILDLYAEFRSLTNGRSLPCGRGLVGACAVFNVPMMDVVEKTEMQQLALRGGPYSAAERDALLTYCQADVDATAQLFERMRPYLDLPRALLRGRYMAAIARMEHVGIPVDVLTFQALRSHWASLKSGLIDRVDETYHVFENGSFKQARFEHYLATQGIPWPRTETGKLKTDEETFKEQSRAFPVLHPLRELVSSLAQLRLSDLAIGQDGRNRTLLSPFGAKTGRNAPSTSRLVFGPSTWLRHLIRPAEGSGLAYIDWSQQEFGIAAALSGDAPMWAAYESGDPYLAFAQQAGAAPPDATKESHGGIRDQFKACVLATQYGMGIDTFACRINQSPAHAARLLMLHRQTYARFWRWIDSAMSYALLKNQISTVFGWILHVDAATKPLTLQNYPIQANAAEMLRVACCLATEAGIRVCCPVHDALLIEAPLSTLEDAITVAQDAMAAASRIVLAGATLRTSVTRILPPDRFEDPRGIEMWRTVMTVLQSASGSGMRRPLETCA